MAQARICDARGSGDRRGHDRHRAAAADPAGRRRRRRAGRGAGRPGAEVAWVVGLAHQGQGYAAEAARALVGWLAERDVGEVVAHIHPGHAASARVAERAGLKPTDDRVDGEVVWRGVTGG